MYTRRNIFRLLAAAVAGTGLASLGVGETKASELERNRRWIRENYKPFARVGDAGLDVLTNPCATIPLSEQEVPLTMDDVEWRGHDGTQFRQHQRPTTRAANQYVFTASWNGRPHARAFREFSNQFVASVGNDNFDDLLRHERHEFEFTYYRTLDMLRGS